MPATLTSGTPSARWLASYALVVDQCKRVLLSVAGIFLVVWGGVRGPQFGADTVRGDITMLAAAVAWSAYTVGAAPLVERYGPLKATAGTREVLEKNGVEAEEVAKLHEGRPNILDAIA